MVTNLAEHGIQKVSCTVNGTDFSDRVMMKGFAYSSMIYLTFDSPNFETKDNLKEGNCKNSLYRRDITFLSEVLSVTMVIRSLVISHNVADGVIYAPSMLQSKIHFCVVQIFRIFINFLRNVQKFFKILDPYSFSFYLLCKNLRRNFLKIFQHFFSSSPEILSNFN